MPAGMKFETEWDLEQILNFTHVMHSTSKYQFDNCLCITILSKYFQW